MCSHVPGSPSASHGVTTCPVSLLLLSSPLSLLSSTLVVVVVVAPLVVVGAVVPAVVVVGDPLVPSPTLVSLDSAPSSPLGDPQAAITSTTVHVRVCMRVRHAASRVRP